MPHVVQFVAEDLRYVQDMGLGPPSFDTVFPLFFLLEGGHALFTLDCVLGW